MDHAEIIELIELAAVEPDGLARLAAGDTAEAAVVAGHLAGCDACAAELARTARAAALARQAIRELPDPALRERTLAYVRAVGRDRSAAAAAPMTVTAAAPAAIAAPSAVASRAPGAPTSTATAPVVPLAPRRSRRGWWAASIAAVLVAAVAGFALGGAVRPTTPDDAGASLAVVQTTIRIAQQPDAVHVALTSAAGAPGSGALVYSATSGELAMAVTGLAPIPDASTYACWVEQAGQRRRIGVLYMDGADGTWAGKVGGLADLSPGTSFGVSLVPAGAATGTPVLLGKS